MGIVYVPKEGYAHNPLMSYPRNAKCFCASGVKFKKCHYGKISPAIEEKMVTQAQNIVKLAERIGGPPKKVESPVPASEITLPAVNEE